MSPEASLTVLQNCLNESWRDFQATSQFQDFQKLFDWLNEQQFFALRDTSHSLPQTILNPAHWYAAKEVCEPTARLAHDLGISFDRILPGSLDATETLEAEVDGGLDRIFPIGVRSLAGWTQEATLTFRHAHLTFYFHAPPRLEFHRDAPTWPLVRNLAKHAESTMLK